MVFSYLGAAPASVVLAQQQQAACHGQCLCHSGGSHLHECGLVWVLAHSSAQWMLQATHCMAQGHACGLHSQLGNAVVA